MTEEMIGEIRYFMGFIDGVINAGEIGNKERDIIQDALNRMAETISIIYGRWEKEDE